MMVESRFAIASSSARDASSFRTSSVEPSALPRGSQCSTERATVPPPKLPVVVASHRITSVETKLPEVSPPPHRRCHDQPRN